MLFRSSSSYFFGYACVGGNNFANLSLEWPYSVCTMKRHAKKHAMKMFVFTQPLISTLCLHYFVFFSHFFHSASCSSSSPGECTALFQNLKHLLYVWSRRLMKMKKKGAQPSVQMSIKIKKGKQFCQWLMLLLLFLPCETELRDIGSVSICAGRCFRAK